METLLLNPNPPKLRIRRIFQEAVAFSWGLHQKLWKWIVLGGALSGLPALLNFLWKMNEEGEWVLAGLSEGMYFLLWSISMIPWGIVFVMLAVYCHRSILLDSFMGESGPRLFFCSREGTFFLWSFVLYVIVGFIMGLVVSVGSVLAASLMTAMDAGSFLEQMLRAPLMVRIWMAGFMCQSFYFFGRWSLIFPAVSVDRDPSLMWSWKQTRGNGWRLAILVGVVPTIASIIHELIWYYWGGVGILSSIFNVFLFSFTWVLVTPLEVAVISIAFRELTNWKLVRQAELA